MPASAENDQPVLPPNPNPYPGYNSSTERVKAVTCRYGSAVVTVLTLGMLGWIVGLIVALTNRRARSRVVRVHAIESINFHLTWGVATTVNIIFTMCAFWGCLRVTFGIFSVSCIIFQVIFSAIAGYKAQKGFIYQYPLTFRILR